MFLRKVRLNSGGRYTMFKFRGVKTGNRGEDPENPWATARCPPHHISQYVDFQRLLKLHITVKKPHNRATY